MALPRVSFRVKGVKLIRVIWFTNLCSRNTIRCVFVFACQKQNSKALHAVSGPAVAAKDAIISWLAKDPLGRFL